jgi:hypothetical protein
VAPIPSASAQGSAASPQASADLAQAGPAPVPSPLPIQLVQPYPQTPLAQGQAAFPPPVPPAPTPQRMSRRAKIGSALGVGAAGVLATLCTRTVWFSFLLKSFASSSALPTPSPSVPDPRLLATYRGNKAIPNSLLWSPDSTKLTSTVYTSSPTEIRLAC